MPTRKINKRVLAIDPFSRGVGFAVLEGPHNLIDWGVRSTTKADNKKAARVIGTLIDRFRPDVLVLEDWESAGSRRCVRVQKLLNEIASGERKHVSVRLIKRRDLSRIGPFSQTATKYTRARLMAERYPELAAFMPRFRKPWMREDDNMSIFDAVSFAVAYFHVRSPQLSLPASA